MGPSLVLVCCPCVTAVPGTVEHLAGTTTAVLQLSSSCMRQYATVQRLGAQGWSTGCTASTLALTQPPTAAAPVAAGKAWQSKVSGSLAVEDGVGPRGLVGNAALGPLKVHAESATSMCERLLLNPPQQRHIRCHHGGGGGLRGGPLAKKARKQHRVPMQLM